MINRLMLLPDIELCRINGDTFSAAEDMYAETEKNSSSEVTGGRI